MTIRPLLIFLTSLALLAPVWAEEIETRDVKFKAGEVESHAYLATPKAAGKYPIVLVAHEFWGHNDFVRGRAEELAKMGYVALALDLYGDGRKGHDPQGAGSLEARLKGDVDVISRRFIAAMKFAKLEEKSDPDKIAAIGYGMGADICLQMARNGTRGLDGIVGFHPLFRNIRPPNPPVDDLPAKILICEASNDVFVHIKPDAYKAFHAMMKKVEVDMKTIKYHVMQSFTVPGADKIGRKFRLPIKYDKNADTKSWADASTFLKELWNPDPDQDKAAANPAAEPVENSAQN